MAKRFDVGAAAAALAVRSSIALCGDEAAPGLRLVDVEVGRLGSAAALPGDQGGVDRLCLRRIRTQSGSLSVSLRNSEACTA